MTQTLETWYISTLAAKLNATDITCTVATAPTVTAWRMHIYKWNTHAWIKYTGVAGTTLTGVSFVSQTADPATAVTWTTFPAWTSIELVEMHDQMLDKQEWWTIAGDITHTGKLKVNKSITVPVYDDATARDVWIPTPENWMIVYNTALWIHQQYISGAWASFASGTTVNADTTTAGKVELPTTDEVIAGTGVWWSGATLAVSPAQLSELFYFWDWRDWAATIAVNTSLTRDMYYTDLTVNTGIVLNPDGYAIYVSGTLTLTGTAKIARNGNAGWAGSQNGGAGTAGVALSTWTCWACTAGVAGSGGGAWIAWISVSPSYFTTTGATGGAGGAGGAAGGAWTSTQWIHYYPFLTLSKLLTFLMSPSRWYLNSYVYWWLAWAGSGGCSGVWDWGWGGSWSSGWIIFIYAHTIAWTGTIEAIWWNWWAGWSDVAGHWGWGGGWGSWGCVFILWHTGSMWTITLTGWTGWALWTGGGGWTNGTAGENWTVWQSITLQV